MPDSVTLKQPSVWMKQIKLNELSLKFDNREAGVIGPGMTMASADKAGLSEYKQNLIRNLTAWESGHGV
jgi:hypothetical protein